MFICSCVRICMCMYYICAYICLCIIFRTLLYFCCCCCVATYGGNKDILHSRLVHSSKCVPMCVYVYV